MSKEIKLGRYRHYKDKEKEYQVIGLATHTETGEELVVYRKLYGDYAYLVRPYEMFIANVDVEGKTMPRFEFLGE